MASGRTMFLGEEAGPHEKGKLTPPRRALAIGAHPDDIEFGCGGTLAKWAAQGCEIFHLVLTDGSKGAWDGSVDQAALVDRRHLEQQRAAERLGGKNEVVFFDWPDGELSAGPEERRALAALIRRLRPEVVFGHDPWKRYRLHPDHRHAGYLTTDAVVAAREPLVFPDLGLPAHRPETLLLFEADEADYVEDIEQSFETKFAALLCHESQLETTMGVSGSTDRDAPGVASFYRRLRERAETDGALGGVRLGEAFRRIEP